MCVLDSSLQSQLSNNLKGRLMYVHDSFWKGVLYIDLKGCSVIEFYILDSYYKGTL